MTLGVIGGLGPMATAQFMEMVIEMTDVSCDQEHLEMIIYNCPRIPDRTSYILGQSEDNPAVPMTEIGRTLAVQGVSCIAIPCITAHYFYDELSEKIGVPIINTLEETGRELAGYGARRAGIMATDGTVKSGLFQEKFAGMGIESVLPDDRHQKYIMDVIYRNIKPGRPADMELFQAAADHLRGRGAEILVLGCTELSVVSRQERLGAGYLDAMEVLAKRAVLACGGKLKTAYENLITE